MPSKRLRFKALPSIVLLFLFSGTAEIQAQAVPTPDQYLGYSLGDAFTPPDRVVAYMRELASQSSMAEVMPYGRTPEGREIVQVVIARPDYLGRLDGILAANEALTAGGTSLARAAEIAAGNPAVVYFSYGIHGDETSSSEAAMWTAYDLVGGDPALGAVLDSLIVIIDPVANPDGRARYVNWYQTAVGTAPNADPQSREHSPPWPGGRFNHYLFDLNRDWAWATQPETQARLATWFRWNPQVHVDFHEMSPNSSYFFFPAAPPINPIYPEHILAWGQRFGRSNARQFDANGWLYFTSESYDLLYPGYGDSWPSLHGAVGMTYEQAGGGGAGLRFARSDGDTLTLAERATHHRTTGAATLRTAAAEKSRLLLDFANAHRTAGVDEPDILLVPDDAGRLDALVDHLTGQGIDVRVARQPFSVRATPYPGVIDRATFPAGTIRVSPRQPRGRLALTLLQARTELVGEYSYDISAWSLPYAYGIDAFRGLAPSSAGWSRVSPTPNGQSDPALAGYGYLLAPSERAAAGVVDLLAAGTNVIVLGDAANFAMRNWPTGSWFIPAAGQPDLAERIREAGIGDLVVPIASGLSQGGPDIGSEFSGPVHLPTVGVVAGDGVVPMSYGQIWFYLEQTLGLPFSALMRDELLDLDLSDYDVLVVPDMRGSLTEEEIARLRGWTEQGGRLVAIAGGAAAVAGIPGVELHKVETEDTDPARFLATREQRDREEWEHTVPGAIVQISLDAGHPIARGAGAGADPEHLFVLHTGNSTFEPREGAEAVGFVNGSPELISGSISEASLNALANSVWLLNRRVGAGEVVLFADDPLFRLFWVATQPLFRNALLYGGR